MLRFGDAFRFPFESPKWVPNLLILTVANIVPLIGPVFVMGYAARVMKAVRAGANHDLDFDQVGDYLLRGLKVFAVSLLLMLLVLPVYFAFMIVFFVVGPLLGMAGGGEGAAGVAAGAAGCLATGVMVVLMMFLIGVLMLLTVPLVLRASLHPDFGAAFSPRFVFDFVRRTWTQVLLAYLVLIVASIPISLAGLLLLVVGVLVASAYLQLVHAHLLAQLADAYEARGGEPVAGTAAPVAAGPPPPPVPTAG